ncbi:Piso0_005199 [Millerozyma farinosa CBS 7064]|uniref:Required for respiratory growth protein 9, mitochondrial n=1 Tax=Pichia sorbitophila (strain ATCC MYA-4447 / BCRC 22081 / CBS 7064 / NBRC 10061 / NRRL Y-12695) TaxID=559304 RepID=G8Y4G9_PICSO|nr:Piso0_005199 [Millerozyma farinosa CBS 7064]
MIRWLSTNSYGIRNSLFGTGKLSIRYYSNRKDAFTLFKEKIASQEKAASEALPLWKKRDLSHRKRYGEWRPSKKLSRQQMSDIRNLKEQMPEMKTVQIANHFKISPEAVRRILRSKWVPSDDEENDLIRRAERQKREAILRKKEESQSSAAPKNIRSSSDKGPQTSAPKATSDEKEKASSTSSIRTVLLYDSNKTYSLHNKKRGARRKNSQEIRKQERSKPRVRDVADIID